LDRRGEIEAIVAELSDSLEQVVYLPYQDAKNTCAPVDAVLFDELLAGKDPGRENFCFTRVAHDHPLWILFSSGTTGLPKAIVHSHVGALMEMMKCMVFHMTLKPGDTSFFYTSTGWVMFNLQVTMLLTGCAGVLYDGSPAYPQVDVLWKMAEDTGTTFFGASPTYVQLMQSQGVEPGKAYKLSRLDSILVGGAPSTPETFEWFYKAVKEDLWVTSQSGGTEIVGGFVGATPTQPVYAGEIQARMLGMDVDSLSDDGGSLIDEVGELVCKKPFPSMPIHFLNDENDERYRESYFEEYPGIWCHGDFALQTRHGGYVIMGRSDAVLNPGGVRIGTAEIYRQVEQLDAVLEAIVVGQEWEGDVRVVLFVVLREGLELAEALIHEIKAHIRAGATPRHVPQVVLAVADIPRTRSGKITELAVRDVIHGREVKNVEALANPEALDLFRDLDALA